MTHPPRRHRSELAVPASRPELFPKAAAGPADAVFLDLEDAVPPERKAEARAHAVRALRELDWGRKIVAVRINGPDTPLMYRDLIALVEEGGERLDVLMVPKVSDARDCYALDLLLTQVEAACGRSRRVGLAPIVETARGLAEVEAIARGSPRVESLGLGVADLAASLGMRTTRIGGPVEGYRAGGLMLDAWHHATSRVVVAARAAGCRPIAGPFGDIRDEAGLREAAGRARALGCEGMMAIHPTQVPVIHEVFSPTEDEAARARRILEAMRAAAREGRAAVSLDGRLLDIASIRQAEAVLRALDPPEA